MMRKLSTGDDATLGNYRALVMRVFGDTNKAVEFLDRKIAESPDGENEEVLADEGQMVYVLSRMAMGRSRVMRKELTHSDFVNALEEVDEKLSRRMLQKGMGTYASIHEILGIVQEEVTEYQEEVHAKNDREAQVQELIDIAVGAIWGIASIRSGGVDW